MVFGPYRDLFAAIATTSGALVGLLFVALSVAPRHQLDLGPPVIRGIRLAAALLAFSNALAVSLFGLVPGTHVGYPAIVLGVIGIAFTAAAIRSIVASDSTSRQKLGQTGLITLLLLIFGTELVSGIMLLAAPTHVGWLQAIGFAMVSSLIIGIARAWELLGERGTGIGSSIAVLTGHEPTDKSGQATESPAAGDAQDSETAQAPREEPDA